MGSHLQNELSQHFHDWGRQKLQDAVQRLLNDRRLFAFVVPHLRKGSHIWLGSITGCLAGDEVANDAA